MQVNIFVEKVYTQYTILNYHAKETLINESASVHFSPYWAQGAILPFTDMFVTVKWLSSRAKQNAMMNDTKNIDDSLIERLKEYVENVAGFAMSTPKDFENLALYIFNETGSLLSSTTFKRLWGYLREKELQTPR